MIDVAADFSRAPLGRYISDGPNSGQRFREDFLIPALQKYKQILVDFTGTRPVGSSFLEEAFGGLRREGFDASHLLSTISVRGRDPGMEYEVRSYMR